MSEASNADNVPASDDRNVVVIFTLLTLFFWVFSPLVGYLITKEGTSSRKAMVELLNFQITFAAAILICWVLSLTVILTIVTTPAMFVLWFLNIIFLIIGTIRASNGNTYRYPFTVRILH
jgi:hypothetical protein